MCGTLIEAKPYTINGRNYVYWEVCAGDGQHTMSVEPQEARDGTPV